MYEDFLQHRENRPEGIEVRPHGHTTEIIMMHDGYDLMFSNGLLGLIFWALCAFFIEQRYYSPEPVPWLGALWTNSDDVTFWFFLIAAVAVGFYFIYVSVRCYRQRFVQTVITIDNDTGKLTMAHRYPSGSVSSVATFAPNEISTRQVVVGLISKGRVLYGLQVRGNKKSFLCYSLGEEKQQWVKDLCAYVNSKNGW